MQGCARMTRYPYIAKRALQRAEVREGAELGGLVALRDADILAQLAWGREDHSVSTGR